MKTSIQILINKYICELAHKHCSNNKTELENSELCGCFYCLKTFSLLEIFEWIDQKQTALCPKCGIDSVIGTASGFDMSILEKMRTYWFDTPVSKHP